MAWLEITIETTPDSIDTVAAWLTASGFADLVLEDETQFENFLEQNRAYWDYIDETLQQQLSGLSRIKLYLEDTDTAGLAALNRLSADKGFSLRIEAMPETDWAESWKENYPAVTVGERFTVVPYWLADQVPEGRLSVILDPGLTFGTGAHPSTQMVMQAMETVVSPGATGLDLGSGSGILSIAALRLGANRAVGVDIDPKAEDIARENAAYNQFAAPEFTALTGNVTTDRPLMDRLTLEKWDVLLVNIVADVIIGLAPVLPRLMDAHTTVICSGILDVRLPDVTAALQAQGLQIVQIKAQEDWRCVVCRRSLA